MPFLFQSQMPQVESERSPDSEKRKKHKKTKGDVQLKAGLSLEKTAALLRAEGVRLVT